MRYPRILFPVLMFGALALFGAGSLLAADPPDCDEDSKIVLIDNENDEVTLRFDGDQLVVMTDEDGHVSTTVVDLNEVGHLVDGVVSEAMVGLEEVLAELADTQLQVNLGRDNRLNLAYDDTEFELDLDQIMEQVADAVQHGLAEIDVERWSHSSPRHERQSEEDLRHELDNLRREMKELRRELQRLEAGKDD